jgi:hypothetical protein
MIPAGVTLCGPDAIEKLDSESSDGGDDDENNEEQVSDGSNDTGSEEEQMTRESLLGYRESLSTPREGHATGVTIVCPCYRPAEETSGRCAIAMVVNGGSVSLENLSVTKADWSHKNYNEPIPIRVLAGALTAVRCAFNGQVICGNCTWTASKLGLPPPCGTASVKLQECAIYGSDESGVTTLGNSSRLLMIRCNINRTARKMVGTLDPEQAPPGIHVYEGSGELVDCVVDDNGQGVGVGKGTVTMTGCAITHSHCWGITVGFEGSDGSINIGDGCTVEGSGNEWAAVMSGTLVGDVKNRGDIKTDFEEYM